MFLPAEVALRGMWDDRLRELLAFQAEFGHVNVRRDWPENPRLARWVINVRRQIRTGALRPERRRRLEELGIRWSSAEDRRRVSDRDWDRMCDALAAFRLEHGHSEVPSDWPANPRLGPWVARQRYQFRTGSLREDRRRRLEKAGVEWPRERGRSRTRDGDWDRMFKQLTAYHRAHGHCRVPKGWTENPKLARWVIRQRHYLRLRTLRPDRRTRLEELGLAAVPAPPSAAFEPGPRERAWQSLFHSLAAFRRTQGHCNVPRRWPWNRKLARWVHHQRDLQRRGLLAARRKQLLDSLDFQWLVKDPAVLSSRS